MDYSKLSDAQLKALHSGDYSSLSDDELKSLHGGTSDEGPGLVEALGRGFGQGGTLGFGEEIKAAVAHPSLGDEYRHERDSVRQANAAAKEAHPWAYGAGQIAGGFVPSMVAAPLAGAAKVATGIGGLMGLGNSTADVTQGDVGGAAVDTGIGAATGYGLSKVGSYIANKLGAGAPKATAPSKGFEFPVAKSPAPAYDPANPPVGWQPKNPDANFLKPTAKDIFSGGGSTPPVTPAPGAPATAPTESRWGRMAGGFVGEQLGKQIPIPGAGYMAGKAGEAIGTKIESAIKDGGLDKIAEILKSAPQAFGRWAPTLMQAAQRGGNALAVQHFLLMQQDAGYRQQVSGQ